MPYDKIKLNLGCGIFYRLGYINIDGFDGSVADIISDVTDLPFKSNCIDTIEAYHLIEHFDYIHCKYVLSEWFRILKPEGVLIIETPDLDKSFKKFKSINLERQKLTLQWIYGIDSPGMQHKGGFTLKLLKNLLEEIGFENVSKKEAVTHRYEPGLRVECRKPKHYVSKQLFAIFRGELKNKLFTDDSDILISLENHCLDQIRDIYYREFDKNREKAVRNIIAKSAICNPLISLIFYSKCIESGFLDGAKQSEILNLIKYLTEINFHKKLVTLWSKSKKEIGKTYDDFTKFLERLESLILTMISGRSDYSKQLRYIASLSAEDIIIFNFHTIQLKARVLLNKGVKKFHKKEYNKALELLLESSRLNPENFLVHWNLARLGIIVKNDEKIIKENYEKALSTTKNKGMYKVIEKELNTFNNKKLESIPKEPIPEYLGF